MSQISTLNCESSSGFAGSAAHAAVQQAGDVGMVERGQRLPLRPKAAEGVVRHHPAPDQLDRDLLLILIVCSGRKIDGSHPPGGDESHQLVGADLLAHQRRGLLGLEELGERVGRRSLEDGGRLFAASEDGFHFGPQLGVAVAGPGQIGLPLARTQLAGGFKDLPDCLPGLGAQITAPL